ncbi:metal ABC transporter ATP-binding protein [Miniphocaeibacter massiliensis]|uniref:metal ABC transporter ATP-binding protein n=1 Tax=Miniphocaeibacter massiliensis TaxID=2041841 RepID=UPI000C1BB14B|nr:metal ABC transporter ATP-binding protein [Miniphocaeibacter massiliensis]
MRDKLEKVIEIKDLSFGYDKFLINKANLEIYKGDFLGIIGANGSGKSTLLKLILGELKPKSGSVKINNIAVCSKSDLREIGYVKQLNMENQIAFPITPLEIVKLNLYDEMKIFKIPRSEHKNKALNALASVRLSDRYNYNFNTMSGGEKQRVLIAKALVNNPDILIFDEPTAGVDYDSKEVLFNILQHLNKNHNITIVVVTHELEFSKKYFNRIIEIENEELNELEEVNYEHLSI